MVEAPPGLTESTSKLGMDVRQTASDGAAAAAAHMFGLHESARYLPDLVLREFPGRHDYIDAPHVEEMEAALLFADVSGFTPLTKKLQDMKGPIRGGAPGPPASDSAGLSHDGVAAPPVRRS